MIFGEDFCYFRIQEGDIYKKGDYDIGLDGKKKYMCYRIFTLNSIGLQVFVSMETVKGVAFHIGEQLFDLIFVKNPSCYEA